MSDDPSDKDDELLPPPSTDLQYDLEMEEDPDRALWREAWKWRENQEKTRRASRLEELKQLRKKLHLDAMTVEAALSEMEGRGDWTQLMRPLEQFGWLDTEPPPRRALLEYEDTCVLPLGKVGFFVGEGGIGKSWALTQLAIAACTGTPWFQRFQVPDYAVGGVVMAMGEEDPDEMHRRIHNIVQHLGLASHHMSMLEKHLFPLPLSGHFMEFLEEGERSFEHERFEQLLKEHAPEQGWKLIILDPASRFMGVDAEKDNAYATRFVQLLERLTMIPGNPTVICAHHTTKAARTSATGARSVAARGASALTDGARWQGNLFAPFDESNDPPPDDQAVFQITKSNYGPKPPAVHLKRKEGSGVLIPFEQGARGVESDAFGGSFFVAQDTASFPNKRAAKKTVRFDDAPDDPFSKNEINFDDF